MLSVIAPAPVGGRQRLFGLARESNGFMSALYLHPSSPGNTLEPTLSIGATLQRLRQARGESQGVLARRAGVSDSTLSRWEAGRRVPCVPELEAVLTALGATDAERRAALRLLDVPRATRRLREVEGVAGVYRGDLLWSLRLRRGVTQADVARAVGVTQAQIARWAAGDSWPDAAKLHRLCWHLRAGAEEVVALNVGPGGDGVVLPAPLQPSAEDWMFHLRSLMYTTPPPPSLIDLTLLAVERRLSDAAAHHPWAEAMLPNAYSLHARLLWDQRQLKQTAHWAERGLSFARRKRYTDPSNFGKAFWFGSVVVKADVARQSGSTSRQRQAVKQLRQWLPAAASCIPHYTWGISLLAALLAELGHREEAIHLSEQALGQAVTMARVDGIYRIFSHTRLPLRVGEPERALCCLAAYEASEDPQDSDATKARFRAEVALLDAESRHALNCPSANEPLRTAERLITQYSLSRFQPQYNALVTRL